MLNKSTIDQSILDNYRIVIIVNKDYLQIFDIWYLYFLKSGYNSILRVITIDRKSDKYLAKRKIRTIYRGTNTRDFAKIVQIRWEVIYEILCEGFNVISSDADAIWLNPDIKKVINARFDLQVSIAYGIPVKAVSEWGFTLCTGFMILQSNSNVKKFLVQWIEKCAEIGDDQIAFNSLFLSNGVEWKLSSKIENSSFSEYYNLWIEAINYRLINRELTDGTIVFHPYLRNYHQNFKIYHLVKYLKLNSSNSSILNIRNRAIFNPISWIKSTYGWLVFSYYKSVKKLKQYSTLNK